MEQNSEKEEDLGGRPKEDLSSLPKDWQKKVISLYEKGASDVEIKGLIWKWRGAYSNSLWNRWLKEESEFSQTIKMGRLLSEGWWKNQGRTNLKVKDFSYTGWYMNMKNRFKWTDRVDQTTKDEKINNTDLSKYSYEQLKELARGDSEPSKD